MRIDSLNLKFINGNSYVQSQLCAWLAKQALDGRKIGGISNSALLLAENGLLNHYFATAFFTDSNIDIELLA